MTPRPVQSELSQNCARGSLRVLQMTEWDSCVTGDARWTRFVSTASPFAACSHGCRGCYRDPHDGKEMPDELNPFW